MVDAFIPKFPNYSQIISDQVNSQLESVLRIHREYVASIKPSLTIPQLLLPDTIQNLTSNLKNIISDSVAYSIPNFDFASIFEGISFETDHVELTESALNSISDFVEPQDIPSVNTSPSGKKTFSFQDFMLYILYPFLIAMIAVMQSHYYQKINSLEESKHQLKTEAYQEQVLQITEEYNENMEQLNSDISEMLEYLNASQELQSQNQDCLDSHLSGEISLNPLAGDSQSESEVGDACDNPNKSQPLD